MQIIHGREMTNLKAITQLVRQRTWQIVGKGSKFSCLKTTKRWSHLASMKNPFRLLFSKIVHQRLEAKILDNHKINNHWLLQMIAWFVGKLNNMRKLHRRILYQYNCDECVFIAFKQSVIKIYKFFSTRLGSSIFT